MSVLKSAITTLAPSAMYFSAMALPKPSPRGGDGVRVGVEASERDTVVYTNLGPAVSVGYCSLGECLKEYSSLDSSAT